MGGLFKAVFFGAAIAVVACHEVFSTEGGAEGVGRATTQAVVVSFMVILVSDYFLTALLTLMKW
jgi:phospholipid/cholesterol/gamma-HCH transport system permease protein